jgi:hypothetical protein
MLTAAWMVLVDADKGTVSADYLTVLVGICLLRVYPGAE